MRESASSQVWRWATYTWMCVEMGQFFETRTGFANNPLFWPTWLLLAISIFLGAKVLIV